MKKYSVLILLLVGCAIALSGCLTKPYMRQETADRLATPAWMFKRQIPSEPFALAARERIHEHNAPADIYIEGDGVFVDSFDPHTSDPTPHNPVALHLATRDKAQNVIYIARPFQYRFDLDRDELQSAYWLDKRFSPEVIDSYNSALDELKKRYNLTGYNLIGYEGGGTIAALLAAGRDDVLSLRTVAGNLDPAAFTSLHNMEPLEGSLNPTAIAPRLAMVPQTHYVGGQDNVMPPAVLHSYLQAVGPSNCVQAHLIQQASHDASWVDAWPQLLADKPTCQGPSALPAFEMMDMPEPHYTSPEVPEKP